ncbi:MAG: EAL domain-containing protein [Acidobacteria bacterium]|nr:EAL domain-containing protein [Acidobacteriota bacterium]
MQAPVGLAVIDDEGTIVACNPAFSRMAGLPAPDLIGSNIRNKPGGGALVAALEKALAHRAGTTERGRWLGPGTWSGSLRFRMQPMFREGAPASVLIVVEEDGEAAFAESPHPENEGKYETLFQSASDAIVVIEGGKIIDCNPQAASFFARRREDLIGLVPSAFSAHLPGVSGGLSVAGMSEERLRKCLAGEPQKFEWAVLTPKGEFREGEVSLNRVQSSGTSRLLAVIRDISSRKRSDRLLAAEKKLLASIAQGRPLYDFLGELCLALEDQEPLALCSVHLLNGDRLMHAAAPSLPQAYNNAVHGTKIGPNSGSCGAAAYSRQRVIVGDISTDPVWSGMKDVALSFGLRACWATPIPSKDDTVLGTFAIYYMFPQKPDPFDLLLVERATHIASIAIEKERAERALQESETRLELAFRGANLGYWDWNLQTGRVVVSDRTRELAGVPLEQSPATVEEWLSFVHPEDAERVREVFRAYARTGGDSFETEFRIRRQDENVVWVQMGGRIVRRAASGEPLRAAGTIRDVTRRKTTEEELFRNAFYDRLTDLPNRLLFQDRLQVCLARTRHADRRRFAVLFLDIDRFKNINDGLGHASGDALILEFSRRLRDCVRPQATIARIGGDEFAILIDSIDEDSEAPRLAERIRRSLLEPIVLSNRPISITASIGIVLGGPHYATPEEVLRDADTAMFRAKASGRDSYVVFDSEMHRHAVHTLEIENALRRALERQELRLHFQPILSLSSRGITGFEALLRWLHPEKGIIPPTQFIPIAEETGLITPIGQWVALEACRQLRRFSSALPGRKTLRMNINLSPRQIPQPGFLEGIRTALHSSSVDPSRLAFEITESALLEAGDSISDALQQLRELGPALVLDDFGTGYASLGYLLRYPIQELKIDRSFITDAEKDERKGQIARTIIGLAKNLGMKVTAEGVETVEQAEWLEGTGCDHAQGFLFSKPLPADQALQFIAGTKR